MKILHLLYESKGDPFGIGGVGIRAYELYGRLRERHDITFLCKKYPGAADGFKEGLKHVYVGSESKGLTKTLLSYAFYAARFVKRHGAQFDVIVNEFSPAVPAFLYSYEDRPVVLQIQGYTGKKYFEKYNIFHSAVLYALERWAPRHYKNFIFVSDASRKRFNVGKSKNVEVISNGISGKLLLRGTDESDYVLYLGRIDIHHKGLDILLHAFEEVSGAFPRVRLVIAGDGRDRQRFALLAEAMPEQIRKAIYMAGWVEDEEKESLISNALLLILPSRYETQGIVALEAMACGKALIVSDIPELRYVTTSGAGIPFRSGDAVSLAVAMKDLLLSTHRSRMGQKGREWVKEHTWDKIALRYEKFLCQVTSGHAS